MRFDELPLYIAAHRVYSSVIEPGSDAWISDKSKTTYKLVLQQIVEDESWTDQGIPWSMAKIVEVWRHLRKVKKARLICRVAATHGPCCFYASRGKGPCSEDLDLDRLLPSSRGGLYSLENCVIACSFHNRSRGDRTIEQYLMSEHHEIFNGDLGDFLS